MWWKIILAVVLGLVVIFPVFIGLTHWMGECDYVKHSTNPAHITPDMMIMPCLHYTYDGVVFKTPFWTWMFWLAISIACGYCQFKDYCQGLCKNET